MLSSQAGLNCSVLTPHPTYVMASERTASVSADIVTEPGLVGNLPSVSDTKNCGKWDVVAAQTVVRAKDELKKRTEKTATSPHAPSHEWTESKIRSATPHQRSLLYRLIRIDEDGNGTVDEHEVKKLEHEIQAICEGLNNYWTALGVVAALIMSITVPYCTESLSRGDFASDDFTNDTFRTLNFIFMMMMFISSLCQFICIAVSVHLYIHLTILMVDPEDKLWFMVHNNIVIPQIWLVGGGFLFIFAIPLGVFVSFSMAEGIACSVFMIFVMGYYFWFNIKYTIKSYAYLDRKIHKVANTVTKGQ